MNDLHISFYQQDIFWGDAEANRRAVEKMLKQLNNSEKLMKEFQLGYLAEHTDIFIVPETFTTGFGDHMAALAEKPLGPTLRWAQSMAAKYNLLFVGTWIVREGDKCYNRLHWVYPNGNFGYYDKAHTFRVSGEADQIARGTSRKVFEYKGWRIKPAVCYDLRFPKWLRNISENSDYSEYSDYSEKTLDYDLLLICANWPGSRHEAWTTLLKARAIENLCYVIGCNRCGIDAHGGEYTGNSAIIDYKGFALAEAETEPEANTVADGSTVGKKQTVGKEQTISFTIHKDKLDSFRQKWPLYLDFD